MRKRNAKSLLYIMSNERRETTLGLGLGLENNIGIQYVERKRISFCASIPSHAPCRAK
jgi:hypothetical protein